MLKNQARANRIARGFGWILLSAHSIYSLLPAFSILNKQPGYEWWPVMFSVDFPVSIPVYFIQSRSNSDWLPFTLFVVVGSIWHFYWPQVLVATFQAVFHFFRKSHSST